MKINEIAKLIERNFPLSLAEPWDHCGIQIGACDEINSVYVALDITPEVADDAILKGANLIVAHHPVIFEPLDRIPKGSVVMKLIRAGIAVYTTHTPFDIGAGGNNDYFIKRMEFPDGKPLKCTTDGIRGELGRIVILQKPMSIEEILQRVKRISGTVHAVSGDINRKVKKIGISTGAGAELIEAACKENDCELFITGDIKYHQAQDALAMGLSLIDATHYHMEKSFIKNMAGYLRDNMQAMQEDVKIYESTVNIDPLIIR